jgi:competence protein ComEC
VRAIYQMHRNLKVGPQENTEAAFIANAEEKCRGEMIRLAVAADAKSYTVTVGQNGKPRRYETRRAER